MLTWDDRRVPDTPWVRQGYVADWNVYPSQLVEVPFKSAPVEFARDPAWQVRGRNELEVRLARPGAGLCPLSGIGAHNE